MNEFVFEDMHSPWDLALNRLHRGDTLSAVRFLALMEAADDQSAEDAALELEQRGVMLDVTGLPKNAGSADTEARLRLEGVPGGQGSAEAVPAGVGGVSPGCGWFRPGGAWCRRRPEGDAGVDQRLPADGV